MSVRQKRCKVYIANSSRQLWNWLTKYWEDILKVFNRHGFTSFDNSCKCFNIFEHIAFYFPLKNCTEILDRVKFGRIGRKAQMLFPNRYFFMEILYTLTEILRTADWITFFALIDFLFYDNWDFRNRWMIFEIRHLGPYAPYSFLKNIWVDMWSKASSNFNWERITQL